VSVTFEAEGTSSFIVELDQFSGPLELLLALIREEEVEITDIPIARICEQFLARIHLLALSEAAEYLEMAARLVRIKAQMLLPRSQDDESWEDPRAELVRRLLEYQQMREIVDVLEDRSEERRNRFARGWLPAEPAQPSSPLALSLPELLSAVDRVLRVAIRPTLHDIGTSTARWRPFAVCSYRALRCTGGTSSIPTRSRGRFCPRFSHCSSSRAAGRSSWCSPAPSRS
jgi:segregation and condensation protein A